MFAVALTVLNPGMSERIAGVMTYGEPREGDDDFATNFDNKFGSITRRAPHILCCSVCFAPLICCQCNIPTTG